MRKIINFRAPFFVAVGLILGIFSFYEFLFGDFWFGAAALIAVFAIGVTLFVLKSKVWRGVVAVLAAVVIGFALADLNYYLLTTGEVNCKEVVISGRVCDLNRNGSESPEYYLENCVDSDGTKYGGRIVTYLFASEVSTGDVVTLRGELNSVYPIQSNVKGYYLRYGVRYELNTEGIVSQQEGKLKLDEIVRKYIFDTSFQYAPQNGDVVYALLTGDRGPLSADKTVAFKEAGIIHLLAVSGLHVGFVVALLCFGLKRFNLHPLLECVILLVPLTFYAYICNFTPSVIRAIVMLVCVYLARTVFGRYDLLVSLSMAALVILTVSPFTLFDLGFQLSALSVFGIATLNGTLNRQLYKRKLPKLVRRIVGSLFVSLSCSVATFFTLQFNYGYAPTLGILLNLVAIPVVSVAFAVSWIGMIPWVFHYVLYASDFLLELVVAAAKWVAGLDFATVSVTALGITAVVVAVWLFIAGGYVNLKKVGKIVAHCTLAAAVALCVGLSFVKVTPQHNRCFVSFGYDDTVCVAVSKDGKAVMTGNLSDLYAYLNAAEFLGKYNVSDCTLYITDYGVTDEDIMGDVCRRFNVQTAYKLTSAYNAAADKAAENCGVAVKSHSQNVSSGDSIKVTPVFDGELRAVYVNVDGLAVTSLYGSDFATEKYLQFGLPSDVFVMRKANEVYSNYGFTTLSFYQSQLPLNYGANKYGNFTITQKSGTISIKFR